MITRLCRSAKCPGTSRHPPSPKTAGPPEVEDEREDPERLLRDAVEERRRDEQADADRGARPPSPTTERRSSQSVRLASR